MKSRFTTKFISIFSILIILLLSLNNVFATPNSITNNFIRLSDFQNSGIDLYLNRESLNQNLIQGDFDLKLFFDGRLLLRGKQYPQNIKVEIYTLVDGEKSFVSILNRTVKSNKAAENILLITKLPRIIESTELHFDLYNANNILEATYRTDITVNASEITEIESIDNYDCPEGDGECLIEYILRNLSFSAGYDRNLKTEVVKNTKGRYTVSIPIKKGRTLKSKVRKINSSGGGKTNGIGATKLEDPYPYFQNDIEVASTYWDEVREALKIKFANSDKEFNFKQDGSLQLSTNIDKGFLNIAAGTENKAPIVFSQGELLTDLVEGALEYDGQDLYFTNGSERKIISQGGPQGPVGPAGAPGAIGPIGPAGPPGSGSGIDLSNGGFLNGNISFIGSSFIQNAVFNGSFQYKTGAQSGYVLTSNSNGTASWQDPATLLSSGASASGTAGAIQFSDGSNGFNSDANNFFWDNTNKRIGIGTNAPNYGFQFQSNGNGFAEPQFAITNKATNDSFETWRFSVGTPGSYDGYLKILGGNSINQNDWTLALVYDVNPVNRRVTTPGAFSAPSYNAPITGLGDWPIMSWGQAASFNGTVNIGNQHPFGNHGVDVLLSTPSGFSGNTPGTKFRIYDSINAIELFSVTNQGATAINSQAQSLVTFTVKASNGQTANLSEWKNFNNNTLFSIANSGQLTIRDGTQANNYVLTSDANGLASWQDPASLLGTGATGDITSVGDCLTGACNGFTLTANNSATIPLAVRGVSSQTANLFEARNFSGVAIASLNDKGFDGGRLDLRNSTGSRTISLYPWNGGGGLHRGLMVEGGSANELAILGDFRSGSGFNTSLVSMGTNLGPGYLRHGYSNVRMDFGNTGQPAINIFGQDTRAYSELVRFTSANGASLVTSIRARNNQTAHLTEWQNSSGVAYSLIDNTGNMVIGADVIPDANLEIGNGTRSFIDGVNDLLVADDVEIDGSLYVNGSIFAPNLDNVIHKYITIPAFGGAAGDTYEFISFFRVHGAHNFQVTVTASIVGYSVSKHYIVSTQFGQTGSVYQLLLPTTSTGIYSDDFDLDINVNGHTTNLRLRKKSGVIVGDHHIHVEYLGVTDAVITELANTSSGVSRPPVIFEGNPLTQVNSKVGINILDPIEEFSVNGSIQMRDGNQALGYVMVSDALGVASWQDPLSLLGGGASGVAGAIQFSDGTNGFSSDDANLFWDDSNKRLGIGIDSPSQSLEVNGHVQIRNQSTNHRLYTTASPGNYYLNLNGGSGQSHLHIGSMNNSSSSVFAHNGPIHLKPGSYHEVNNYSFYNTGLYVNKRNPNEGDNNSPTYYALDGLDNGTAGITRSNYLLGTYYQDSQRPAIQVRTVDANNSFIGFSDSNNFIPNSKVHVHNGSLSVTNGNFMLVDGSQANGYVLTSDANGLASWQDPSSLLGSGASASGVAGAIQFSDGSNGFNSDAGNFFWNNTTKRLGIGTNNPASALNINGGGLIINPLGSGNNVFTVDSNAFATTGRMILSAGGIHGQTLTFTPRTNINSSQIASSGSGGLELIGAGTSIMITNNVGIGSTSPNAKLDIELNSATEQGLILKSASMQTANLTEWQNFNGTQLLRVANDGGIQWSNTPDKLISPTAGSLNWISPFASTVNFSSAQVGQYSILNLITNENKLAGLAHYDVANVRGRLLDLFSNPAVDISISPSEVELIRFSAFGTADITSNANWNITSAYNNKVTTITRGANGQTADLSRWQDFNGNTLTSISASGSLKITDGTQANGYVLTSDTNGLASWQDPANLLSGGASASGIAGAIQFSDGSNGFNSNAANLFWNNSNGSLGIGTSTPNAPLTISKPTTITNQKFFTITANGYEIASLQEGILPNYGGTLSLNDASGAGNYVRLRYDAGYPKLETNRTGLTFQTSTTQQRLASTYIDFTMGAQTPLIMQTAGPTATFTSTNSTNEVLVVRGAINQNNHLTEWQDRNGTQLLAIGKTGRIHGNASGRIDFVNSMNENAGIMIEPIAADGRIRMRNSANPSSAIEFWHGGSGIVIPNGILTLGTIGNSVKWGAGWSSNSNNLRLDSSSATGANAVLSLRAERYADVSANGQPSLEIAAKSIKFKMSNPSTPIGTGTTIAAITENGKFAITDGTQTNGYVFTSNINGEGSWKDPASLLGAATSSGIAGTVQFSDGSNGFNSNAANFFWDNTNGALTASQVLLTADGVGAMIRPSSGPGNLTISAFSTPNSIYISQSGNSGVGIKNGSSFFNPAATLDVRNFSPTIPASIFRAAVSQTANLIEWQNGGGAVLSYFNNNGQLLFSNQGTYDHLVSFGSGFLRNDGAIAASVFASELGKQVALNSSQLSAGDTFRLGWTSNTGISDPLDTYFTRESAAIIQVGNDSISAVNYTFKPGDGLGTDIAGASLTFAAGRSTGSAVGGDLIFQTANGSTSGASQNTLDERMRITDTGEVGIGENNPQRALHIKDVMRLEPRATAPTAPATGDIYIDSDGSQAACVYLNGAWVVMAGAGSCS